MAYKMEALATNGLALKKDKYEFGFDYVLNLLRIAFVELIFIVSQCNENYNSIYIRKYFSLSKWSEFLS